MKDQHNICSHKLRHRQPKISLDTCFQRYGCGTLCFWTASTIRECKWQNCFHQEFALLCEIASPDKNSLGLIYSLMHMQIYLKSHTRMILHWDLEHSRRSIVYHRMLFLVMDQFRLLCHCVFYLR
jgi:hypothetical protein